ncbi:hypothetical protein V757_10600 [Pelistega indica]|uniref:Amidohydrolase-related domain-containing protein n=1 Tax=Pelistega indica TaxID=1414851 RepID=V8FWF9_9BURK|nr:amidohydrolase family protein [Pelistega indica]ETD68033.1 hypothetical protein V757_10600 [Pelistega indica]
MNLSTIMEIPKFDAHMHIWNISQKKNPWLMEESVIPFRYGDYTKIRKNYLLNDYQKDFKKHNIFGTAFVETEWIEDDAKGEIEFVISNNQDNFIRAILCQSRLEVNFREQINIIKQYSLVKGIRQKPKVIPFEDYYSTLPESKTMLTTDFLNGLEILDQYDLIFEVQTAWWHLPELIEVKQRFPNLKIVINHAGMPGSREDAIVQKWYESLKRISHLNNVFMKISGFGEFQKWDYQRNQVIYQSLTELFDSKKLLFGTNFPVDSIVVDANYLMDGFYKGLSHLNILDLENIFYKNAVTLYKV